MIEGFMENGICNKWENANNEEYEVGVTEILEYNGEKIIASIESNVIYDCIDNEYETELNLLDLEKHCFFNEDGSYYNFKSEEDFENIKKVAKNILDDALIETVKNGTWEEA